MQVFSKIPRTLFVVTLLALLATGCGKQVVKEVEKKEDIVTQEKKSNFSRNFIYLTVGVEKTDKKQIEFKAGQTALEVLKSEHKVETKNFSGVGEYVKSIDGLEESVGKNFWAFYVNGTQSQTGAGDYKLKSGDVVEWKLETLKTYK